MNRTKQLAFGNSLNDLNPLIPAREQKYWSAGGYNKKQEHGHYLITMLQVQEGSPKSHSSIPVVFRLSRPVNKSS